MDIKNISILTFGSCGWDRIMYKNPDGTRELVYEEEGRKNSHQAVAAKRAGAARSALVSFVGDDEIGARVLDSLKSNGVDTKHVTVVPGEKTEVNNQILDKVTKDYELERGPAELSQRYAPATVRQYADEILRADFVILVSKQPHDFLTEVIEFCHAHKIKTVLTISHPKFDIKNITDLQTLKKLTFIAGNFAEAAGYTGKSAPEEMLDILPNLILTHGADGVWFRDESGRVRHEPAIPVENVVETNGAGDTFIGNFVVFYAKGHPITECVRIGQSASAIEVGKMGVYAAMPYWDETLTLYEKHYKQK